MSQRSNAEIARFISTHLPPRHLPEIGIALHLAQPQSGLTRFLGAAGTTPYWAYPWAGGLALAHHVIAHQNLIANRTILDFGAGSGLVGIVAARLGAHTVIAVEPDPVGRLAIGLNASANSVSVTVLDADITAASLADIDLILAGDVFYDASIVAPVLAALDRALALGIEVLIGDPGRAPLPLGRLDAIARYTVADVGHAPPATAPVAVHRLRPPMA